MSLLFSASLAAIPSDARGQAPSERARWFDLAVGVAKPLNGKYLFTAGPAIDARLAVELGRSAHHRPVLMIGADAQGGFAGNDKCVLDGLGKCLENLPTVLSVSALLGVDLVERRMPRSRWSAIVSVGPGISAVSGEDYGEHASALSWHGRMDVGRSFNDRAAVVASLRTALLPSAPLNVHGTGGGGLGVRIRF
jgi:hypothetical protein